MGKVSHKAAMSCCSEKSAARNRPRMFDECRTEQPLEGGNTTGTAPMDGPPCYFEWAILDSNQRPLPCEASAMSFIVCH